jgi:RimJ/RimL family protein N-acetyltransferase
MPFRIPWTDRSGQELVDGFVAYHLAAREDWRPDDWSLLLTVYVEGLPAGSVAVRAERFAERREFDTGSWLGREFQGRGIGTEMRRAALELGFAGLGARVAVSGAFDWNAASLRVSEKLGYRPAGEATYAPRGEPERELVMRLTYEEWARGERIPVEIDGLEPCLPLFGL